MKKVFLNKNPLNFAMLNTVFLNGGGKVKKGQGGIIDDGYIRFKDPEVLRVLLANGVDKDGDGGITEEESAAVTSIGTWFRGNTVIETFDELEKFTGITSVIGNKGYNQSFSGCTSLRSIVMPINATIIGDANSSNGMFKNCTALLYVDLKNISSIGSYAFIGCSLLSTLICNWEKVISIGVGSFFNCTSLAIEDFSLPNLETLGVGAFRGVKIKKVSNLGKITSIPQYSNDTCPGTFGDPNWLEELVLPDTLVSIGWRGLMEYTALKYLNIPSAVTSIGTNACHSCSSLEYIVIKNETPPSYSSGALTNTNNCPIYVPDASVTAYKEASGWSTYADRIKPLSEYTE